MKKIMALVEDLKSQIKLLTRLILMKIFNLSSFIYFRLYKSICKVAIYQI